MASSFARLRGEWSAGAAAEWSKGFGGSGRAVRPLGDEAEARGGAEFEEAERGDHGGRQEREDGVTHRTAGRCVSQRQERVRLWGTLVSGGQQVLGLMMSSLFSQLRGHPLRPQGFCLKKSDLVPILGRFPIPSPSP